MNFRKFGKTDWQVSEIGLGTWQLGSDWGKVAPEDAEKILTAAHESGINFIDTADVYGSGRSERLIGKFLKEVQERKYVITKLGRLRGYPDKYSPDLFRKCTEDSLKRLGVDALDVTQLHCIPKNYLESGEVFDWLQVLVDEGKIRYYGASVETMEEALICLEQKNLVSLQIIFNIFRQKPVHRLFQKAREKNVALVIRLPLASGLLAGKFTKDSTFPRDDHRNYNKDGAAFNVGETFAGLPFEKGVELADELKKMVPNNLSMVQFSLRWILDYPEVSVLIPGAKNQSQVEMNASASASALLSADLHQQISEFYENYVTQHIRGPY